MRRREKARGTPVAAAGYTMIEIIMVAGVIAVAALLMYGVVGSLYKSWITEGIKADMRQNARMALETVTKDLEMAGYQTTKYGDENKANLPVTLAAVNEIEVDQQRLSMEDGSYAPRMIYYHLATDAGTGRQNLYRQVRVQPGLAAADEIIAESVSAFTISYFDADGAAVASLPAAYTFGNPPPQALKDIRRICVAVTAQSERPPPTGTGPATMSLSTCVTPRNLTIEETALDAAPPSTPTGLTAADTGSCTDKLCLRWSQNPETDLAGYVLYYGAGTRTVPVASLADPANPRVYLNPGDLLITKFSNRISAPNTYGVSISAYDSSGNHSPASGAISGPADPGADERDCVGGTVVDTTVNPVKPAPPSNMSVATGAENELTVSWTAPADGSATAGFRLYRREEQFTEGVPVDPSFLIADETTLTPGVVSYTDSGLIGCQTYYYAVASVNCDETLIPSFYVFDKNAGVGDYDKASGDPLDLTPPPPTSLADTRAGFKRIFLDFDNPLADETEDFSRTEIYFNAGSQCPSLQPGGNVSPGKLIPDSDGGIPGTFVSPGTRTTIFDHPDLADPGDSPGPSLINQGQYCLLSVAYDDCENTALDSSSLVLVDLCGDDPLGPPPDWPLNPTYSSCNPEWVKITWDYPPKDYTGTASIYDFAGYRIWRTGPDPGSQMELTDGPTWSETWTDGRDLQEGGQYRYEVRATDCVYENDYANFSNNYSTALQIPSDSTWVSPGRLTLFEGYADTPLAAENFVTTFSDSGQPFTFHNNVRFFLENTSRATMTMETISLLWGNPNVVLASVAVGGPPSTTALTVTPAGGVSPGAPVSLNTTVSDTSGGLNQPSGPVPVVLRFTNTDGSVNRFTDMRSEELLVSLQSRNNSLQQSTCDPENFVVSVPRGPVIGGFVQDWPAPFGSPCYEVVGRSGSARDDDIQVPGLVGVNVSGLVFDNSGDLFGGVRQGFDSLSLFTAAAAVTPVGQTPAMPTGVTYSEIPLEQFVGDRYAIFNESSGTGAKMPQSAESVAWYYIVALDRTGNFDRFPDPDFGACAYYQKDLDPCLSRPKPPFLNGDSSTSAVDLDWTVPTENVDGGPIPPGDTLLYDVYLSTDGGPFSLLAGDLTSLLYTHSADMTAASHAYHVRARNACAAELQESDPSNLYRECQGESGIDCGAFTAPATVAVETPFAITARDICLFTLNGVSDTVTFRVSSSVETKNFTVGETGDSGTFSTTLTVTDCEAHPETYLAASISATDTLIPVRSTTCFPPWGTISIDSEEITYSSIIGGALAGAVRGVSGSPSSHNRYRTVTLVAGTGGNTIRAEQGEVLTADFLTDDGVVQCTTEVAITDPCSNVPRTPSPFDVNRGKSNETATLTWGRPLYNTDGSPVLDLGGYEIEARRCKDPTDRNCDDWSPWEKIDIPDPSIVTHLVTGLQSVSTGFRVRAYDTCSPVKRYSEFTDVLRK